VKEASDPPDLSDPPQPSLFVNCNDFGLLVIASRPQHSDELFPGLWLKMLVEVGLRLFLKPKYEAALGQPKEAHKACAALLLSFWIGSSAIDALIVESIEDDSVGLAPALLEIILQPSDVCAC
jgi:hypothetical protein